MAEPSVDTLKKAIKEILKGADLDSLSTKKVRKMLEEKFDTDFLERKKEIDKLVMKMIDDDGDDESDEEKPKKKDSKEEEEDVDADENGVSAGGGSDAESGDEVPKKKAKKSTSSSATSTSKLKKRKSAGKADDSEDPVMSSIKQMDDEDLAKKLQDEETGLRRRRAAAPKPKKEREKDTSDKKKKPSLYSRPCHLSDQLAAVVGTKEMPRPEVVKTLWSIVKERNLQDPKNKQFMLCDAQMETLFGVKRVKLFGMMKHLKRHITDLPR